MRYFTDEHEWIDVDGDVATVGIRDFAQGELGDIVCVELPGIGTASEKGKDAAVVESVKAASDVYAPTMQSTPQGSGPVAGALPTTHRSEPASVEVMSGPPEGQGPLRPEEIGGEIWAPGACGIAPG